MSTMLSGWSPGTGTIDVGAVYERHAPEIHDFLVRTVRDHATAEDLTQTTFIRLLERGDSVREMEKVRPWLFTVAHNLAVTHVTRRRPTDPIEAAFDIASGDKGPEDEALAIAAAALVWDAARSLEPRQYAVLDLSVRRGFSVAEIAEVLKITAAHAAVVVHRAREALAQAIRLLVVVRQRRHCARLAEIVPAGTDLLTPDLRASVDRHMRRCEVCKQVGARLTEPAELLGAIPLLPLPLALQHMPHLSHAVPLHHAAQHVVQKAAHALMQPVALATVAAVAIAGTGLGVMLHHGGGAPAAVADTTRPHGAAATLPGGTHAAPQAVPGLPGGSGVDLQPLGPGGAGVDGGSGASGAGNSDVWLPGGSGGDALPGINPPTHGSQGTTPTPPPQPLLDLQLPPPLVGPLPAGVHVVIPHPGEGQPTVTITPGPGQASHR